MYGSKTWTLYEHDVSQLRTIQQRHLRLILNIKWDHFVSNEEVLKRAGVEDIETMLIRSRLRWLGHICRMDDTRAPKQLMYGELARGSRPVGRPKLRFRDTCKNALKCGEVLNGWQSFVNCRQEWRGLIETVCENYTKKRVLACERRRVRSLGSSCNLPSS